MKDIFKSKYTGEQVEEKLDNSTKVVGNPDGSAVADLVKIQIGNNIYFLPYGSSVSANSDIGEEGGALNSITINGVRYVIEGGGTTVIGNPSGPAVADLTKIQIGNDIYYLPYGSIVSANSDVGEDGGNLNTITINGVKYIIPIGGTIVEGNPSDEATAELSKLKVGETIYSIPTGQSGGKRGYSLTLGHNSYASVLYYADGTSSSPPVGNGVTTDNVTAFEISYDSDTFVIDDYLYNCISCIKDDSGRLSSFQYGLPYNISSNTTYFVIMLGDGGFELD